ncbi:MAG: murein hydrolase activator EnvC family protein [Gemmatimonadota bacterium]
MRAVAAAAFAFLVLAVLAADAGAAGAAGARESVSRLRKEKARLTEIRRKAEKTAAELADTIRREKSARDRVGALRSKLARQRRLVARIDRKLEELGADLSRAEGEVRELEAQRDRARTRLRSTAAVVFLQARDRAGVLPPRETRLRRFARLALVSASGRVTRLTEDKERKEDLVSGIERRLELSERKIEREKRVGDALLSQRRAEEKSLADLSARKKRKEKELKRLRARVARMESLVARIERRMRDRDRRRKAVPEKDWPSLFSRVAGGLVPPVNGKVTVRFGRQRDPDFDVEVESHGVEIETGSGSAIRAVGRGEVVFSGSVSGFGKVLIIQHGAGLFSVYGKAASYSAERGRIVARGEVVGRLPQSPGGKSVLYLELRAGGAAVDPASVISLGPH